MKTKSQQIRETLVVGNDIGALRIAAHFFDRSPQTLIYKQGLDAHNHQDFYRQLGHEPEKTTAAAIALLKKQFLPS